VTGHLTRRAAASRALLRMLCNACSAFGPYPVLKTGPRKPKMLTLQHLFSRPSAYLEVGVAAPGDGVVGGQGPDLLGVVEQVRVLEGGAVGDVLGIQQPHDDQGPDAAHEAQDKRHPAVASQR